MRDIAVDAERGPRKAWAEGQKQLELPRTLGGSNKRSILLFLTIAGSVRAADCQERSVEAENALRPGSC